MPRRRYGARQEASDRRQVCLALTPAGRAVTEVARAAIAGVDARVLKEVSKQDMESAKATLRAVVAVGRHDQPT